MKKTDALGQCEQLVLAAVLALRENAYGVTIHSKVGEMAERPVKIGSVYITLERLVAKKYLESWLIRRLNAAEGRNATSKYSVPANAPCARL